MRDAAAVTRAVGRGRYEAIFHLAARAGVGPSIHEPRLYVDTNITGTLNLLEAARAGGVERFVFASSSSVYGLAPTVPFREDMPLAQTISPYAATKLAAEQLCSNYAHLHGLRAVCLRFFNAYGPRLRPDLAIHQFTRRIHRGQEIEVYGDGSFQRDFTYIDDTIQGVVAALTYDGPIYDVFNLGEYATTSVSELIALIEGAVGKKASIRRRPAASRRRAAHLRGHFQGPAAARLRAVHADCGGHPALRGVVSFRRRRRPGATRRCARAVRSVRWLDSL